MRRTSSHTQPPRDTRHTVDRTARRARATAFPDSTVLSASLIRCARDARAAPLRSVIAQHACAPCSWLSERRHTHAATHISNSVLATPLAEVRCARRGARYQHHLSIHLHLSANAPRASPVRCGTAPHSTRRSPASTTCQHHAHASILSSVTLLIAHIRTSTSSILVRARWPQSSATATSCAESLITRRPL